MVQKRWSRAPGVYVCIPLSARFAHTRSLQHMQKQHTQYAYSVSANSFHS